MYDVAAIAIGLACFAVAFGDSSARAGAISASIPANATLPT